MDFQGELNHLTRVSPAIRDALRRHPEWLDWLKQRLNEPDLSEAKPQTLPELRDFKQRKIIEIAFRDLSGLDSFEETVLNRLEE